MGAGCAAKFGMDGRAAADGLAVAAAVLRGSADHRAQSWLAGQKPALLVSQGNHRVEVDGPKAALALTQRGLLRAHAALILYQIAIYRREFLDFRFPYGSVHDIEPLI